MAKMKQRWFWVVPLVLGAGLAWWWPNHPSQSHKDLFFPAKMAAVGQPPQIKLLTDYLLDSQQLFSRAISLSQHPRGKIAENNQRVSRLINEAITEATAAISHYPADPRGYAQRAQIYQAIDKYLPEAPETALRDWEQAGRLGGNDPHYWQQAAKLCLKLGKINQAVQDLQHAAALVPTDGQLLFNLAKTESKAGQLAAARRHYQQLLSLLVDEKQRQQVLAEIKALDGLLAQTPAKQEPAAAPTTAEMVLKTPKLEASRLDKPLVIAAGEEGVAADKALAASNALSGTSVLPGGQIEVTIRNRRVTSRTQIYLTAMGSSDNQPLRLARKGKGYFVVKIGGHALNRDLPFKWLLVPADSARNGR